MTVAGGSGPWLLPLSATQNTGAQHPPACVCPPPRCARSVLQQHKVAMQWLMLKRRPGPTAAHGRRPAEREFPLSVGAWRWQKDRRSSPEPEEAPEPKGAPSPSSLPTSKSKPFHFHEVAKWNSKCNLQAETYDALTWKKQPSTSTGGGGNFHHGQRGVLFGCKA